MKPASLNRKPNRPERSWHVDASSAGPSFSGQKRRSTPWALSKTRSTPRAWALALTIFVMGWAWSGGCSLASPAAKQSQSVDTKLNAVAEKIDALNQTVVNAPSQTVNQLWPLVALLLGLGALTLVGVMWWIARHSYVGQFEKIAVLKAQACKNGAKT